MAKATRSSDNSLEKCFPDFDCAECGTHYQIHYPANRNTYHWQYDNKFFCCRKCYLAYFERKQEQKRRNFCKKSTKEACAARTRLSAEQALKRGKEVLRAMGSRCNAKRNSRAVQRWQRGCRILD